MLQVTQTTGMLSLVPAVPYTLRLEDLGAIPYSPRLLLLFSLPDVITNDAEYAEGCELGFDMFFAYPEVYESRSFPIVRERIMQELFPGPSDAVSLAACIGLVHGFLSLLAFVDRALALRGLSLLACLTDHLVFLSSGSGL